MLKSALTGVALLLVSLPANAATVVATWTGKVGLGAEDRTGMFGGDASKPFHDSTHVEGMDFTLTYTFDTEAGVRLTDPNTGDTVSGGSDRGDNGPFASAVLTINGVSATILGSFDYFATTYGQAYSQYAESKAVDEISNQYTTYDFVALDAFDGGLFPTSLDKSFSMSFGAGSAMGNFSFLSQICDNETLSCDQSREAFGSLEVRRLSVNAGGDIPASVPLPASGFLLFASLAATGALMSRRRSTQ